MWHLGSCCNFTTDGYATCLIRYPSHFPALFILSFQFFVLPPHCSSILLQVHKHLTMSSFTSTVCGYSARTVFDCQSPVSTGTVSPSFGQQFKFRRFKSSIPLSVKFCLNLSSRLLVPFHVSSTLSKNLSTLFTMWDWFNYCTTSIPDASILLSDETCLIFSSSPFSAVLSRHTSESLVINSCHTTAYFLQWLHLSFVDRKIMFPILWLWFLFSWYNHGLSLWVAFKMIFY